MEKCRINILMRFKASDFEAYAMDQKVAECLNQFYTKQSVLKNADDCEAYLFIFMNAVNRYIISEVNKNQKKLLEPSKQEQENFIINEVTINILAEIVEQFQLCLAKLEWIKIKNESHSFSWRKEKFSSQETLTILNKNIYELIQAYKKEQEPEKEEEVELEKKEDDENEELLEKAKEILAQHSTVPSKLTHILAFLDEHFELPTSLLTSTEKRYIYSMVEPVHPSGKPFFNKSEVDLQNAKKKVYLETNFSQDYGDRIAMRMVKKTEELGKRRESSRIKQEISQLGKEQMGAKPIAKSLETMIK
ncbi:hypothetical protein [Enterococcus rivorum]|uniref:hypothetical protein n=1 Tax=Enterococcus rivorum TaxID=762845 RepID=UPI00363B06C6